MTQNLNAEGEGNFVFYSFSHTEIARLQEISFARFHKISCLYLILLKLLRIISMTNSQTLHLVSQFRHNWFIMRAIARGVSCFLILLWKFVLLEIISVWYQIKRNWCQQVATVAGMKKYVQDDNILWQNFFKLFMNYTKKSNFYISNNHYGYT